MALNLSFTIVERGDNKLLTITDSTGVYDVSTNPTGWGTPNATIGSIDNASNKLTLTIVHTSADGTITSYADINTNTIFGPFITNANLVFPITMAMLFVGAIPAGTADDEFPDGLYSIKYQYQSATFHTDYTVLIDGRVKVALYELLRTMYTRYECEGWHEKEILDIIFAKGYYDSMIATAISGREDQVIGQLAVLERLITNGSNYTW